MTQDELIELLRKHEWRDVEFKEAQRKVPRDAYETVSAFANTEGGHLVFGVRESGQEMEIVGVLDVDKVQNEFLSTLRQPDKISVVVDVDEDLHKHDESALLVFYVPEVHRSQKPVFLNGDIRRAFVRSGGSDVRCSDRERNGFLIDAAAERPDGRAVDLNPASAFDPDAIRWYRAVYEARPGNRSCAAMSDVDFLAEMGLLVEQGGRRLPTRAAILIFGTNPAFRQLLPRPVVDCQRFTAIRDDADTGERWFDRLVLDENLIRTWRSLIDWYEKLADHPFRLDPATLRRDDTPPDYRAFRESMINLIMHQDYSDHSRKAVIRYYADQTVFWNPGDAFAADTDLLEPGEREVRNPRIVLAFRRIGLSEHAGWGLRDVFRNWQQLGHVPPLILSDRRRKSFELVLKKEELLSEQQLLFQGQLGVRLTDDEARTVAIACRQQHLTLSQIKAVTGLSGPKATAVADRLVTQVLLERAGDRYVMAGHLRARLAQANVGSDSASAPSTAAADRDNSTTAESPTAGDGPTSSMPSAASAKLLTTLSATQWRIVELCDVPRRLANVMVAIGETDRSLFRTQHVDPLLEAGILRMTIPGKPTAAAQRYVLTEAGAALKAARLGRPENERRGQP
ncbi:MAG: AAA family ATPase [Acidobacteria bacterium]|nr:AAA family ATPase [Acidobacteriota bacterium]